jgi:deazaflavin-dependent oxidoreductase (nitroreductase family)
MKRRFALSFAGVAGALLAGAAARAAPMFEAHSYLEYTDSSMDAGPTTATASVSDYDRHVASFSFGTGTATSEVVAVAGPGVLSSRSRTEISLPDSALGGESLDGNSASASFVIDDLDRRLPLRPGARAGLAPRRRARRRRRPPPGEGEGRHVTEASPKQRPVRPSTERELRRMKPFVRAMSAANRFVFRLTRGRVGGRFAGGAPVGLLTTTGRRSGRRRTTPLIFLEDGPRIVLVASLGGMPKHPVWYLNLSANPEVEFQAPRAPARRRRARTASDAEKKALWPRLCAIYPPYDDYQKRTEREIPVVILEAS